MVISITIEYPRHTGDYTFIRGYVGKDGKPAPYAVDNVPYQAEKFLKVNASGVRQGDGILLAGYPGPTSRYRLADEISFAADWQYPAQVKTYQQMINTIDRLGATDGDLKVKYASTVKGHNNRMKKLKGLLEGFKATDIQGIKLQQQQQLVSWIAADSKRAGYQQALSQLQTVIAAEQAFLQQSYHLDNALRSDLLKTAADLYRLALEQQKPDAERETGFQQRDMAMFEGRLKRLDTRFRADVDLAVWTEQLAAYLQAPARQTVKGTGCSNAAGANHGCNGAVSKTGTLGINKVTLITSAGRLAWLGKKPADFTNSTDPFIRLAVAMSDSLLQQESQQKELAGRYAQVRPAYMQAIIAYNQTQGKPVYPDANGTLRITIGHVDGYPAADGVYKTPFTTVRGMLAKEQAQAPFQVPAKLRTAYQQQQYQGFYHAEFRHEIARVIAV